MSTVVVSPTGEVTALAHESLNPIVLFTTRTVRNFSQAGGLVQAGNIATPAVSTDRDAGGPLVGLAASRIMFEGMDPQGLYVEMEATASAAITTIAYTVLFYTSEDGVTWHFWTSSGVADTTALISGNPADSGFQAAAGTSFRAFGPFAGLTPPPGTKYIAVAIRNNTNVAGNDLTISGRVVLRPT